MAVVLSLVPYWLYAVPPLILLARLVALVSNGWEARETRTISYFKL
jgi:hypothetical protein